MTGQTSRCVPPNRRTPVCGSGPRALMCSWPALPGARPRRCRAADRGRPRQATRPRRSRPLPRRVAPDPVIRGEVRGLVTDGDDGTTGTPTDFGPLIDFATRVLAPAGALSAVLYYFGYVRVQALYGYFGADVGSLGFSTVDYVVSSAGTFFVLLVTLLVAGVVAVAGHYLLQHVREHVDVERRRLVWVGLGLTATALLVLGVVGLFRRAHPLFSPLFAPCCLGAGTCLLYTSPSPRD